ncbi:uncharacterized protein LOC130644983 isoform X2 [Hydractinia symbiolongicarpus]|uniref:uncharacterized protein LOC130644983 isoform X2 n=1 Tax=Hydractinia symbiolongicarpus TaxID=13093 RepID=UPI00254E0CDA|nr:uncharacterized protein LOC130644983 isoform X2 [Hydractinia symbiolongicarpus]
MENYKSLEAHKFFVSGWVQTLFHMWLKPGYFLAKCEVKPSYRTNDKPHQPWVALNQSGSVLAAHCSCMAGLGETCSHVAATLYKIEAAVRLGLTTQTPTDVPCQWNQNFTKDVNPSPVASIQMYSPKFKAPYRQKELPRNPTELEKKDFLNALKDADKYAIG